MNKFYSLKFELDEYQWKEISRNPSAIFLLEDNPDKISWRRLSENPNAIHLLNANPDKIDWYKLGNNTHPKAIEMLDKNIDKKEICWHYISLNPSAVVLFEKYKHKLIDFNVARNHNPKAIDFLKKYPELIDWNALCQSRNDTTDLFRTELYEKNKDKIKNNINWDWFFFYSPNLEIIKENINNPNVKFNNLLTNSNDHIIEWVLQEYPDKIDWYYLSMSNSKIAIKLIKENIDKIYNKVDWYNLSRNPNTISLLEKYPDKIVWDYLLENPVAIDLINSNIDNYIDINTGYCEFDIFLNPNCLSIIIKYHYEDIKNHFYYNSFGKELIEWIYNPKNMDKWSKNCWDLDL